jgi:uncharacterized protein
MRRCSFILVWIWCLSAIAAEVIPPAPVQYFNDYAHVVNAGTVNQLDTQLENFEKSTGNQVVVAVYPKIQSDSSIDDYCVRVARSWKAGQKLKNNGVVLFVFIDDRKLSIQVGYGLEGALPDATCKQITEYEIKPRFKAGDYAGGLTVGVNAILAATRGEFKGNGTLVHGQSNQSGGAMFFVAVFLIVLVLIILPMLNARNPRSRGWVIGGGGWGGGGGGGFSGGGGGGFSGGGGSFGGGGASSSW